MPVRLVSIVAGAWLFISAFLWPHAPAEFTNTWVCGVLAVVFGVMSLTRPAAAWLNTLLSLWLVIGTLAFHWKTPATVWSNVLCAVAIFVSSLSPEEESQWPSGIGPGRRTS
jgi:hypothetical protein